MAHVILIVEPSFRGFVLTWSDGPAAFAPYELAGASLTAAADVARRALGAVVENSLSGDTADGAAASATLATAGYALYQAVFKPAAEQQAQATEVRKWLDKLNAESAVESLEVVADGIDPIPWNVVYDRRPEPEAFQADNSDRNCWQPFWGIRYDLAGGRRVSPLRRFPVLENPRVLVVCEAFVLDTLAGEREALRGQCQANGWTLAESRAELVAALLDGRPDILYWLGHTQTDPFGLVLGDVSITPDELRQLLEGDVFAEDRDVFGGIAFLNACGTATREQSGSFLEALHPLGLSGYVATEQSTIDTFAAPLGREFLDAFIVRGEPLGRVMRQLRGRVPLGLLYGTYCPPRIHVRREPPASEPGPIIVTSVSGGRKLGRDEGVAKTTAQLLPANPYRALQAYSIRERALFAGRDEDVLRFANLLDEEKARLVILHGESGVGKTSFLRAGLLPYLEQECVGYRFARDRTAKASDSVLFVRATNDLVTQLATALSAFCSTPFTYRTPSGEEAIADLPAMLAKASGGRSGSNAVRDALKSDPGHLAQLLSTLSRELPFTPVLVIDQAEEVFTLARTPADEENRTQALEMLRRAASHPTGFKIVVSLRTEYHGRFTDRLRKGTREAVGIRDYLLTDFGLNALIEVIRRPTSTIPIEYASEVPSEKYRFRFAEGVAEEIARRTRAYSINRSDSVLPLVQVICSHLYERARTHPDGTITLADLDAIGGVEGGMRAHTEGLVRRLFPSRTDQLGFKRLLSNAKTQLFIRQSDGTLTTALLPAEYLARHWSGRLPFDDVLRIAGAGDWRLLRVNSLRIGGDEQEQPYVSLGHDALATVTAAWQDSQKRRDQFRRYATALVVMFAVMSGLTALTAWALEQRKLARANAQTADQSARAADEKAGALAVALDDKSKAEAEVAQKAVDLEAQAKKLTTALDEANTSLSNANILRAWMEWERGDASQTRASLDMVPDGYRNWEWGYLSRQTMSEILTLKGPAGFVLSASLSADGSRAVTADHDGLIRVWDTRTGVEVANLRGHEGIVNSMAFAPDGRRVVSAGMDTTARVWDLSTGVAVCILKGHNRPLGSASFSPDGTRVVTASADGLARVWNALSGKEVAVLKGHNGAVLSASFSPDGTRVLTGSDDSTARVWNAENGAEASVFKGHTEMVTSASFSPDGMRVLTASVDQTARVWDAQTGHELLVKGREQRVFSASFSPDGTRVVSSSDGGTAIVWDAMTGAEILSLKGHLRNVGWASFSPDGTRIVTASRDGTARVWDARNGAELITLKGHFDMVLSASFSPDGSWVLTIGLDGTARIWDARFRTEAIVLTGHVAEVYTASFSLDGTLVVTACAEGTARVWNVRTGAVVAVLEKPKDAQALSVSFPREGARAVIATPDGTARIWDIVTGKILFVLKGHTGHVYSPSFTPDGSRLVTASEDGTARVWDVRTGASLAVLDVHEFKGPERPVWSATLSASGGRVVTTSYDGTARIWVVGKRARVIATLQGHTKRVSSASFSSDNELVLTASEDGTARIWNADTGSCVAVLNVNTISGVLSAAFSSDGTRVVTAGLNGVVKVWDSRTGAETIKFERPMDSAEKVSFSPDGTRVLSLGEDTARLWDVRSGVEVAVLRGHTRGVNYASFSPDGTRLVTASSDGTARIWDARPAPTTDSPEGIAYRRYLTRPRPDLHAAEAKRLDKDDPFAGAMHRSLEQRALGILAFEAGDTDLAQGHFIAAAMLKPKPPGARKLDAPPKRAKE